MAIRDVWSMNGLSVSANLPSANLVAQVLSFLRPDFSVFSTTTTDGWNLTNGYLTNTSLTGSTVGRTSVLFPMANVFNSATVRSYMGVRVMLARAAGATNTNRILYFSNNANPTATGAVVTSLLSETEFVAAAKQTGTSSGFPVYEGYVEFRLDRVAKRIDLYVNNKFLKTLPVDVLTLFPTNNGFVGLGDWTASQTAGTLFGFKNVYLSDDLGDGLVDSSRLGPIAPILLPTLTAVGTGYTLNAGSSGVTTLKDSLNSTLNATTSASATPNVTTPNSTVPLSMTLDASGLPANSIVTLLESNLSPALVAAGSANVKLAVTANSTTIQGPLLPVTSTTQTYRKKVLISAVDGTNVLWNATSLGAASLSLTPNATS